MPELLYKEQGINRADWLTRARHGGAANNVPYTGKAIGIKKPIENLSAAEVSDKRFGPLFYLSHDLSNKTAFSEIYKVPTENVTLGYFYIKDSLKLLNLRGSFVSADATRSYDGTCVNTLLFCFSMLIHEYVLKSKEKNDKAYKVSKRLASLFYKLHGTDGILY